MMTKDEKRALGWANVVYFIFCIPMAIYQAFVMSQLWEWFILTNFHSAPALGIVDFLGINVLVSLTFTGMAIGLGELANRDNNTFDQAMTRLVGRAFGWVVLVSFALLFGFIYHLFI